MTREDIIGELGEFDLKYYRTVNPDNTLEEFTYDGIVNFALAMVAKHNEELAVILWHQWRLDTFCP